MLFKEKKLILLNQKNRLIINLNYEKLDTGFSCIGNYIHWSNN